MGTEASTNDQLVSLSEIARLANVSASAVINWRKRFGNFPKPIRSGESKYFRLGEVIAWLEGRRIPVKSRRKDEPQGTTYADRARRKLATLTDAEDGGTAVSLTANEDDTNSQQLLDDLLERLHAEVQSSTTSAMDSLLLVSSAPFLKAVTPATFANLQPVAIPGGGSADAEKLLRLIGDNADIQLRNRGLHPGMRAALTRLEFREPRELATIIAESSRLGRNAFRLLLDRYSTQARLESDEFPTPSGLCKLVANILLSPERSPKSILDLHVRGGEMLHPLVDAIPDPSQVHVHGEGTHREMLQLTGMGLALRGLRPYLKHEPYPPWARPDRPHVKADIVVTNPPFNRGRTMGARRDKIRWPFGPLPKGNDNFAWLQHAIESLNPDGRAAVVMPKLAGTSANRRERDIRRAMVEQGTVECIITLPSQLFAGTSIAASVWFLRPPTGSRDQVLLIDAGKLGTMENGRRILTAEDQHAITEAYRSFRSDRDNGRPHQGSVGLSVAVQIEEIRDHGYLLDPADYQDLGTQEEPSKLLHEAKRAISDLAFAHVEAQDVQILARDLIDPLLGPHEHEGDLPTGWQYVPLHELCDIKAGPSYSRLPVDARSAEGDVPVVLPKDLRNGRVDGSTELVAQRLARDLDRFQLEAEDILCIRSGTFGPPALVTESETGWLFGPNLLRLRQKRSYTIDAYYLLGYLSQPRILERIKGLASNAVIPSLSTTSLGQFLIVLPPFVEQQQIGRALHALDRQVSAYRSLVQAANDARTKLVEHLIGGALVPRHTPHTPTTSVPDLNEGLFS